MGGEYEVLGYKKEDLDDCPSYHVFTNKRRELRRHLKEACSRCDSVCLITRKFIKNEK